MPKPIVLIYFNDKNSITSPYELHKILEERWPDYHLLVIPCTSQERTVELEVFHEKDFTDIQYSELKALVEKSLEELKSNP